MAVRARSPLKMDPTRTLTLRRKWERDFVRRLTRLKKAIVDLVSKEDAFGLGRKPLVIHEEVNDATRLVSDGGAGGISGDVAADGHRGGTAPGQVTQEVSDVRGAKSETGRDGSGRPLLPRGGSPLGSPIADDNDAGDYPSPVGNQRFRFLTTAQQVDAYNQWLRQQVQLQVLAVEAANVEQAYWNAYVKEAYSKGAGRAFDDANKPYARGYGETGAPVSDFYRGSRYEFLRSSFAQPVSAEKVKLLAGRVFTDLKGVTEAMATQMSRTLTDGLAQGKSPLVMARDLTKTVDDIGIKRARVIARTETIRAHAEGQLDSLERMGVTHVGVMVEWSTTGDDLVCELCASMEGVVLEVGKAHSLIPRHPQCRCAFIPANVGEDKTGQKRSKGEVEGAIDDSVRAEGPTRKPNTLEELKAKTKWPGADVTVPKARPKSVLEPPKVKVPEVKAVADRQKLIDDILTHEGVSDAFALEARGAIDKLSTDDLEILRKGGYKIKTGRTIGDVRPDLKGVVPRGWASGDTWDIADGMLMSDFKTITITEYRQVGGGSTQLVRSTRVSGVLRHETGHAIDEAIGKGTIEASETPAFQTAWRADIAELLQDTGSEITKTGFSYSGDAAHLGYVMQPLNGRLTPAGAEEAFAEAYAHLRGGSLIGPVFGRRFPRTVKAVEEILSAAVERGGTL